MRRFVLLLGVLLLSLPLAAQEITGALQGRVTDASAGVLPGATVTISGDNILGGSRSAVTSGNGAYRLANIPPGVYQVSFALSGFGEQVYEGVRISTDTTFTLNAELSVAALEETVTVTGEAPVIETAATDVAFNFTEEVMENVPNARDPWAMVSQVPGVTTNRINVGGTETGNQLAFRGHGVFPGQNIYVLNGANVTDNQSNGGSQFYFDVDSFEEMQIEVSSHSAEVQTPGMVMNIVPKSGSNNFSGTTSLYFGNEGMQSDNVDSNLMSLGVDRASNLNQYLDVGAEVGGPLIEDKLWWWAGHRHQVVQKFVTGTQNPDGSFPIDETVLWYPSAKINWAINQNHNFSVYFNMAQKKRFNRSLSSLRPLPTTWNQQGAPIARLFTFRDDWTPSPNVLVAFKANVMDQGFELRAQPEVDVANTPARLDLATGQWSDAPPLELGVHKNLRNVATTVSWYRTDWGGDHDFKAGFEVGQIRAFGNQGGGVARNTYPADHRLHFFEGEPSEVILWASGAVAATGPQRSAFLQDSWAVNNQLRLNLGARWDWQANSLDQVTAPARAYLDPVSQEGTGNLIVWNTISPRLGMVFDLTGDARTLFKASYGRYYWVLWLDRVQLASVAGDRNRKHEWNDLNGDRNFTIDEAGAVLSVFDAGANPVTIDGNLDPTYTDEFTVGLTREVAANVSASATIMWRRDRDITQITNTGISAADYTAVTGTDPGPDGALGTGDDGGGITFYELDASKTGLSPNFLTTRPGFEHEYRGFEFNLHRRLASNWQFMGSITIGEQSENYGPGSFDNVDRAIPDDRGRLGGQPQFPLNNPELVDGTRVANSTPYLMKVLGTYQADFGLTLSGFYQYISGNNFTRTVNAQAALGRRLNQGNVRAFAGERNGENWEAANVLDLRAAYDLGLGDMGTLSLQFDVFNALNINTITNTQSLSGGAFGRVLAFVPPRIFRLGAKLRF